MQPEAGEIFDFATTMACVIVISLAVEKPQRNCSVIQRNVLAFPRNRIHSCTCILSPPRLSVSVSGLWAMSVGLPPDCPAPTLREVSVGHSPDHTPSLFAVVKRRRRVEN